MKKILLLITFSILVTNLFAQCLTCGNGLIDSGETYVNCPQDVPHPATCMSPCSQPKAYESATGILNAYDFTGTTTFSSSGLPSGWTFASAPSSTTSGTLAAAGTDAYGAKAGLVQPNCSGGCTNTNGFCIGNLANLVSVGSGGSGGKLGANFDARANINQNLSYAVLRGTGNPTLVSPSFNMSSVEGFKVQFWLFPSETSCGQTNSWGSCVGNEAYLDFSSNGGSSWTQILTMDLNSANSDMCLHNTSNTLWMTGSSWSRVCLTVYKSTSSPGNFYPSAASYTAASGIMVNSAYFTSSFQFRIRYAQTASCTSVSVSATNPGRYLAIDYPAVTSGNQMIPCGLSFINTCGYGADANDDGVGGSGTSMSTAFGTVKRSVNNAEKGVEIFTSQNNSFAAQNLTGSNYTTDYDLCNAEGGDKQCIDWSANNNFYTAVYEVLSDMEAPTAFPPSVQYFKVSTPQSVSMSKVTALGKSATIGWRYQANRIVSCGSISDLNPGCNGYSFYCQTPTQMARGFYNLAVNSTGQAWTLYGATSCSNYFNGPFFSPVTRTDTVSGAGNYITCINDTAYFIGLVNYCNNSSGFSGTPTLVITGPGGFIETINSGTTGTIPVLEPGQYTITPQLPASPSSCVNCVRTTCLNLTATDLCSAVLPVPDFMASDTVFCYGNCVDFTDQSFGATSWRWYFPGGTPSSSSDQNPQQICYVSGGNFDVKLVAGNDNGSDSLLLSNYISVYPEPPVPVLTYIHDTIYIKSDPSYKSYQWYKDSVLIVGATDTSLFITQEGNYNVKVIDLNDCEIGVGINIGYVGMENTSKASNIIFYPNPASEQFVIESSGFVGKVIVRIFTIYGSEVRTYSHDFENDQGMAVLDIKTLSAGVYLIRVEADNRQWISRMLKL